MNGIRLHWDEKLAVETRVDEDAVLVVRLDVLRERKRVMIRDT